MILIFAALIFSDVGYGATPSMKADCAHLMIKAGLMASGELTPESATQRYLLYLKHFVKQGYLNFEDLKLLKKFAEPPNLIDTFGNKIPEAYVYRDEIEKLLPLVNQKALQSSLDEIIKEKALDNKQKEKALDETEIVQEVTLKEMPFKGQKLEFQSSSGHSLHADEVNGLFVFADGLMSHLETGKQINLGPEVRYYSPVGWTEFMGETYCFFNQFENDAYHFSAYNAKTGEKVIEITSSRFIGEGPYTLFIKDKKLSVAWGQDFINTLPLPEKQKSYMRINLFLKEIIFHQTEYGELFAVTATDQVGGSYQIIDVSHPEKAPIKINTPQTFGSPHSFLRNPDGSFNLVFIKTVNGQTTLRNVHVDQAGDWQEIGAPVELAGQFIDRFSISKGAFVYILTPADHKHTIFNSDNKVSLTADLAFDDYKVITLSTGESYFVGKIANGTRNTMHIWNLQSGRYFTYEFDQTSSAFRELLLRTSPDGRLLTYIAKPTQSGHIEFVPFQLYGPMNPKTGEAAP